MNHDKKANHERFNRGHFLHLDSAKHFVSNLLPERQSLPVLRMEVDVHSVVFKILILNLAPAGTQYFKFAPAGIQNTKGMSERREACETCN